MKTWADFYQHVNAEVPGVAVFDADRKIRLAAQEFCERTKAWRMELDPVILLPKIDCYEVDAPPGAMVVEVLTAHIDRRAIALLANEDDRSHGIAFTTPTTFRVLPEPIGRARLHLLAVLKPTNESTGIGDDLFANYVDAIAAGAKARLFAEVGKPYSNPAEAERQQGIFEMLIAKYKIRAAKGFSGAPLRTRPNYF